MARGARARPQLRLRIATWNINSLRLRQDRLAALVAALEPDILCLQETKVPDELFPEKVPAAIGLPYFARRGMKSYNGVAILSRIPFEPVADSPDWCGKGDCRHVAVRLDVPGGPIELHNFYVPAGGDIPDPDANPKFAHKLAFVAEAHEHFSNLPSLARTVVVGDLNIAPLENDVWSHRQLLDVVSHTPVETKALDEWRDDAGFTDAVRHFVPADEKLFTWWSYRNRDWRLSDRGRRLDHIWVSEDLTGTLERQTILKDARDWELASDHVPVCVEMTV
ncbi:MAG TPA: exodeoxyribonuclease III [Acetobacteraceae bacterium]|nr:exodeoxyribonuclease III [Acetobacteraceae bacterium]